jgi:ribosomal protein S18 acetylase RimI-like enzyme
MEIGLASGNRPRLWKSADEAETLLRSSLHGVFDGAAGPGAHARVADGPAGRPVGWAFVSRDAAGPPHVWELWWIGVARGAEGKGHGAALLADAEAVARAGGARMLLVSTSSAGATARARALYKRKGFALVGRIPGYYGEGEDKLVFWKGL